LTNRGERGRSEGTYATRKEKEVKGEWPGRKRNKKRSSKKGGVCFTRARGREGGGKLGKVGGKKKKKKLRN